MTDDLDAFVKRGEANLARLARLLEDLEARDSRHRSLEDVVHDLRAGGSARFRTRLGGFDVMTEIPAEGNFGYAAVRRRAVRMKLGDQTIWVAALDDIVAMKEQAHRVKDLARLPELRRIQQLQRRKSP